MWSVKFIVKRFTNSLKITRNIKRLEEILLMSQFCLSISAQVICSKTEKLELVYCSYSLSGILVTRLNTNSNNLSPLYDVLYS